jgi:hypothetical protein
MNDSMRRAVHKCTTKIERHHRFAKHLAFGEYGWIDSLSSGTGLERQSRLAAWIVDGHAQ